MSEVVELVVKDTAGSVKKVGARDLNMQSLRCEISDGHEYEYVQSRKHGEVQVLRRICKCMDHKMHGLLMTLEYTQVSELWHILRMYHRVMMWSMSSEAIAEHVGSLIRYIEKNTVRVEHSMCLRSCALLACGRPVCAGTTAMPPLSCEQCRSIFGSVAVCILFGTTPAEGYVCRDVGPIPENCKDPRVHHCRPRWP